MWPFLRLFKFMLFCHAYICKNKQRDFYKICARIGLSENLPHEYNVNAILVEPRHKKKFLENQQKGLNVFSSTPCSSWVLLKFGSRCPDMIDLNFIYFFKKFVSSAK